MSQRTCAGCGAVYDITKHRSPMRDMDKLECEICGELIMQWNGGVFYTMERVQAPAKVDDPRALTAASYRRQ